MKNFKLIMMFLVFVTGTKALAAICPVLTGRYEVKSDTTQVEQSADGDWITNLQISILQKQPYPNYLVLRARDPYNQVYGSDRGDYVLDGKTHFLAWDASADNYFVKYKANCYVGMVVIEQEGADNNSVPKRVSTYRERMVLITQVGSPNLSVTHTRMVLSPSGELVYKAQNQKVLELK